MKKLAVVLVFGFVLAAGCGRSNIEGQDYVPLGDAGTTFDGSVTFAELESLEVVPALLSLAPGETFALAVQGAFTDGSVRNLTSSADKTTYSSSNAKAVTVTSEGVVAGAEAGGSATITARNSDKTATCKVTVTDEKLVSIAVEPASLFLAKNGSAQLNITGWYDSGRSVDLTPASSGTIYKSSSTAVVAVDADGFVEARGPGRATISASNVGVSGQCSVEVRGERLVSIAISPAMLTLSGGETGQFSVTGTYSDGSQGDLTNSVMGTVYESDNPAIALVGPNGQVSARQEGTTTVTAANAGLSDSATVNVKPGRYLQYIQAVPHNLLMNPGQSRSLAVTGYYSDGSTADLTGSATGTTYQVPSFVSTDGEGTITAIFDGQGVVTVANGGFSDVVNVTVTADVVLTGLTISPSPVFVSLGGMTRVTVTGQYSNGSSADLTAVSTGTKYSVGDSKIASAGSNGEIYGVGEGKTSLTVTHGGLSAKAEVTVSDGEVYLVEIKVSPSTLTLDVGQTGYVKVSGRYSDGQTRDLTPASTGTTYTVNNPMVARAGGNGDVTGMSNGETNMYVRNSGVEAVVRIYVTGTDRWLEYLEMYPYEIKAYAGDEFNVSVTGYWSDGSVEDMTWSYSGTSYWSDDPRVVEAYGDGYFQAVSRGGPVTIWAENQGITAASTVWVEGGGAKLMYMTIDPPSATMRVGDLLQLNVIGYYDDGSSRYLTQSSTGTFYQSSDTWLADVDANGLVTAYRPGGPVYIQAFNSGVSASCEVRVQGGNVTLVSINLQPDEATIPWIDGYPGLPYNMRVLGTYSDGSQKDLTASSAGTSYSSSNRGVATVSSEGVVNPVSPGSTTVTAKNGGFSDSSKIIITEEMPESISCEPAAFSIAVGATQQLTVWANFPSGARTDVTHFTSPYASTEYRSSAASIASVDSGGLVKGVSPGDAAITATLYSFSAQCRATVKKTGKVLQYIWVEPSYAEMYPGETLQLYVTGYYSDGSTADLTSPLQGTTYKSDQRWLADVDKYGLVYAYDFGGPVNISVSNSGLYAIAEIMVGWSEPYLVGIRFNNASPVSLPIFAGQSIPYQLYVVAEYSDGSTVDITGSWSGIQYSAYDPGVAEVDSEGVVNARGRGTTYVYAEYYDGASPQVFEAEIQINVTQSMPTGLRIEPDYAMMFPGDMLQLTVYLMFQDGSELDITRQSVMGQTVRFSSSDENVAWVDEGGMVYANDWGGATIRARFLLWRAECQVEVMSY
ncbi:MAG: Ig-like domain-containing protein [Deltaproteobacteria bacterium]|nr:Ig-like domain-containing protein [Deltaproteobacteria bacterium]